MTKIKLFKFNVNNSQHLFIRKRLLLLMSINCLSIFQDCLGFSWMVTSLGFNKTFEPLRSIGTVVLGDLTKSNSTKRFERASFASIRANLLPTQFLGPSTNARKV